LILESGTLFHFFVSPDDLGQPAASSDLVASPELVLLKYEAARIFCALPSSSAGVSLRHPRCSFPIRSRPVSVLLLSASTVSRAGIQFIYLVTEGALFRFKRLPGDRRSIIQFLFPGDAFGYEIGRRHRDTVEALTNVKIRSVGREALLEAAAIDARVSNALSTAAIWSAITAEDQSIGLRGRNATEQLALFFLEMDARLSKGGEIDLPMRRQHIADYYGLTMETVSRTINSFRRSKIIEFSDNVKLQRRVVIRDKGRLSRFAPDAPELWWKTR
jgi:CRP-like cAMP-binding protein